MAPSNQRELEELSSAVFKVRSSDEFEKLSLRVFQIQAKHVPIYKNYCRALNVAPASITNCADIPFLPIDFFRTHEVMMESLAPEVIFESSGTSGAEASKHFVHSTEVYLRSALSNFEKTVGSPEKLAILCLLPSYLERGNSSLVWMCERLVNASLREESGFYLDQFEELARNLEKLDSEGVPTLLIGVSFALIDFADQFPMPLKSTWIMETGGMKGRRR